MKKHEDWGSLCKLCLTNHLFGYCEAITLKYSPIVLYEKVTKVETKKDKKYNFLSLNYDFLKKDLIRFKEGCWKVTK